MWLHRRRSLLARESALLVAVLLMARLLDICLERLGSYLLVCIHWSLVDSMLLIVEGTHGFIEAHSGLVVERLVQVRLHHPDAFQVG